MSPQHTKIVRQNLNPLLTEDYRLGAETVRSCKSTVQCEYVCQVRVISNRVWPIRV